jgi:hypothetical protein
MFGFQQRANMETNCYHGLLSGLFEASKIPCFTHDLNPQYASLMSQALPHQSDHGVVIKQSSIMWWLHALMLSGQTAEPPTR